MPPDGTADRLASLALASRSGTRPLRTQRYLGLLSACAGCTCPVAPSCQLSFFFENKGGMKTHINFATHDLTKSIAFYRTLLGVEPAKAFDDYALFITEDP